LHLRQHQWRKRRFRRLVGLWRIEHLPANWRIGRWIGRHDFKRWDDDVDRRKLGHGRHDFKRWDDDVDRRTLGRGRRQQ
jgi:hypothetical protein